MVQGRMGGMGQGGIGTDGSGWDGSGQDGKMGQGGIGRDGVGRGRVGQDGGGGWPEGLKSEFKDYYPSRSSQKDNDTVIEAILNKYGEQNVEIPYEVIDNHVVFNIPVGEGQENIMYPIENVNNVEERELNINDM